MTIGTKKVLAASAAVVVMVALFVAIVVMLATGRATGATGRATSCPPENVFVQVNEPSGPPLWIDFIGSGSAADSPMRDSIKTLTADGFFLRSDGSCGAAKATACVVIG